MKPALRPRNPAVNFVVFLLLGVAVVSALANGFDLIFRLAYLIAAGIAGGLLWSRLSITGMEVETRRNVGAAQIGQELEEHFAVRNRSRLPKLALELEDLSDMPGHHHRMIGDFAAGQTRHWVARTECRRRGRFHLGPMALYGSDPFGVFRWERLMGPTETVVVYPRTVDLPEFALSGSELTGEDRLRLRSPYLTPNASTVRDYAFGDSFSRMHWPSTARTGRLMVKEFDQEPGSRIWVALDLHGAVQAGREEESTEEYGVTAAASVASKYLRLSRAVGLVAHGEEAHVVPPDKGERQVLRILGELAAARARGDVPLSELLVNQGQQLGHNSTLVIITPSSDPVWLATVEYLGKSGVRPVLIYLEAAGFAPGRDGTSMLPRLAASGLPVYVVRAGDRLEEALSTLRSGDGIATGLRAREGVAVV